MLVISETLPRNNMTFIKSKEKCIMNNNEKDMTPEEIEQDFKDMVFDVFSQKVSGVYRDENGFIVVPTMVRKKPFSNTPNETEKKESK